MQYLTQWSKRSRALAEGLVLYEGSIGPHGLPRHIAQDRGRKFVVDEVYDGAQAALDEAREEYSRGNGLGHGVSLVVVDEGPLED